MSCDFESGLVASLKQVWPNTKVKLCSFHLVSACSRKLKSYFKVNHPNARPITKNIFNLTAALPYVPWSTNLVNIFLAEISDIGAEELKTATKNYHTAGKGQRRDAREQYEAAVKNERATQKFVKYLSSYFLSPAHRNGWRNWGYEDETTDFSNNCNESCNHLLKMWVSPTIKNYSRAVGCLRDFLADWVSTPAEKVTFSLFFSIKVGLENDKTAGECRQIYRTPTNKNTRISFTV